MSNNHVGVIINGKRYTWEVPVGFPKEEFQDFCEDLIERSVGTEQVVPGTVQRLFKERNFPPEHRSRAIQIMMELGCKLLEATSEPIQ